MKYDTILVLGCGTNPDGTLPLGGRLRVEKAVEIYQKNPKISVIMSGGKSINEEFASHIDESESMKEYAISLGIPATNILTENHSAETVGNAYFCKINILLPHNFRHILVITANYHIARAEWIFQKVLGPDFTVEVIGIDMGLSEASMDRKEIYNRKALGYTKSKIGHIADGDHTAIGQFMFSAHPGYATNPPESLEEVRKKIEAWRD